MSTKEKIVLAAVDLFTQHGYEAASMAQIASAAGIKKPSIYAHYESKLAIFEDALRLVTDHYESLIREAELHASGRPPLDRLYVMLENQLEAYFSDTKYLRFLQSFMLLPAPSVAELVQDAVDRGNVKLGRIVSQVAEEAHADGTLDPEISAHELELAYFALMDGIMNATDRRWVENAEARQELLQTTWRIFEKGLRP
ncbi:TetR/AcrR family transcriptional regulator [Alkalicoccus chagannorensis]|uniref:TetR/AcrR family transcriptional regulator n=1 Tax=Alkalicoccus chagannorensis TaxID=427072 RepID=UPI00041BD2EB|nr:TetR/AcrR family transcriptional regulator [Alkalicoccus chagannorensis]